jgi:hypothetical protein
MVMDIIDQMKLAYSMTRLLVAELSAGGCNPIPVAVALCGVAGAIYREELAPEDVREVISRMAENMIRG